MMLFFDVGETLASEERWLGSWADWLGVPRPTFFAALGALIEARRPHQEFRAQPGPGGRGGILAALGRRQARLPSSGG